MTSVLLAVNGTLMRGFELNGNLIAVNSRFVKEAQTAPCYRLWSINDKHPAMQKVAIGGKAIDLEAMQKVAIGGKAIDLEIWEVPTGGLARILKQEPPGLCIGKIELSDGEMELGVLGEALLCDGQNEITGFGGWRAYCASKDAGSLKGRV